MSQLSPRVVALFKKTQATRGRLIFALDATASREGMWDLAAQLQSQMFEEAAKIGGLDIQLLYYRGSGRNSINAVDVRCARACQSNEQRSDARPGPPRSHACSGTSERSTSARRSARRSSSATPCEELPSDLYAVAESLGVPLFVFQEGSNWAVPPVCDPPPLKVETIFRELARLTNGAYGKFDAGAAMQLGELLRAVAAFAVGGVRALANQHTDSARKLLGQMK